MKVGVSSYSFLPLLQNGEMQIGDVFSWLAEKGADHMELASLTMGPGLAEQLTWELGEDSAARKSLEDAQASSGVPLSGICIPATFIGETGGDAAGGRRFQIDRAKRYVDLCADLGVRYLRHDVVPWSYRLEDFAQFEEAFDGIVEACREITEHGAARGVVTSIEDHGFFMNGSERLRRLVHHVGHDNFGITLDVGNFLCVDEDALIGGQACLPQMVYAHLKDFHIRRHYPGPGWLETYHGRHILGSVFGHGDLDTRRAIEMLVEARYDGFVSLEFEGKEHPLYGVEAGINNIRRLLDEVRAAA